MVANSNVRQFTMLWMRRLACYFIGFTSATGMFVMILAAYLMISGVLEW